jgi:hypothetical protein
MRARLERVRDKWYGHAAKADSWEERYWDLEALYERTYPVLGPPTQQQHRSAETMAQINALARESYRAAVEYSLRRDWSTSD